MSITSGYTKYKRYAKLSDGTYKLVSQWTNANTVHFDDGSTAQTNLGAIKGITSDLAGESQNVAASIYAANQLNSKINELNSSITDLNDSLNNTAKIDKSLFFTNLEISVVQGLLPIHSGEFISLKLPDEYNSGNTFTIGLRVLRDDTGEYVYGFGLLSENMPVELYLQRATQTIEIRLTDMGQTYCAGRPISILLARIW